MLKNAIKRWQWKKGKNIWGTHRNTSPEAVGTVKYDAKRSVKGTTYTANCLPFGVLIIAAQTERRSLLLQNKDAANSAFISFGTRDLDDPAYQSSIEVIPGQTLILNQNVFTNDVYGACTVAAGNVILSVTEGIEV